MAISSTYYQLLRELREAGELPQGGKILEIGQANFYGDCDPREWLPDIERFAATKLSADIQRSRLSLLLKMSRAGQMESSLFGLARLIYSIMFSSSRSPDSIDFHGCNDALRLDLNSAVNLGKYSVVLNHGTAEHIFNIAQVFRTMHDCTEDGGLMIHEAPFTGWIDHGFYSLQPTLFFDLAHANGYEIVKLAIEDLTNKTYAVVSSREEIFKLRDDLPKNTLLFVAIRKRGNAEFVIPQQGVYDGRADMDKWRQSR